MEKTRIKFIILVMLSCNFLSCNKIKLPISEGTNPSHSPEFRNYWLAGKAEVNTYHLNQSRYGEPRTGKAVLIFVTEDFSKKLQVKVDNPNTPNKINVLKTNFTKNFITGIYPYSMMLSVFTPVNLGDNSHSLKVTMSSQEWCGQVFTQLNLRGNRYAIKSHSYFEQEGDERFSVRETLLEDELWNFIRLDHEKLPVGKLDVLPGLFFTRLNHADLRVQHAIAEKSETDSLFIYRLTYPDQERDLTIRYQKNFPYKIVGWKETWKEKEELRETTAVLDNSLYTDYWKKNKNEFQYLRDSLGLPPHY